MAQLVSMLLGKRVTVRRYDDNLCWYDVVRGVVMGVAFEEGWFTVLLAVALLPHQSQDSLVHLWYLGHVDVPSSALLSISTKPGMYTNPIAIVVEGPPPAP
jgi:hypothetical protein